jgi:hypothetical protein
MTNEELEAKVVELEKEVATSKLIGTQVTELIVSTLEQYRCKTCHLYHFPEPFKNCLRKDEEDFLASRPTA